MVEIGFCARDVRVSVNLSVIPLIWAVIFGVWATAGVAQNLIVSEQDRERWQAVGRVNVGGFRSRGLCTGTLIAPDKVLTAAHCVVDPATGVAFPLYRVHFVAAWHMGTHRGAAKARAIQVHTAYPKTARGRDAETSLKGIASDVAVISLDMPLEDVTPAVVTRSDAQSGAVAIPGYRRDRPEVLSDHLGCNVISAIGPVMQLDCPVVSGTSGAPVLRKAESGAWEVIGVVSARNPKGAVAVRVTQSELRALMP